jgi:hypothetical protein
MFDSVAVIQESKTLFADQASFHTIVWCSPFNRGLFSVLSVFSGQLAIKVSDILCTRKNVPNMKGHQKIHFILKLNNCF